MPRGTPLKTPVTVMGTRYDLPFHEVPPVANYEATSILSRHNVIVPRPGLTKLFATGFGEQVMGGIYVKLNDLTEKVVAGGLTKWKVANFGTLAWDDITGTPLTGTEDDQVRFIKWPESGSTYVIGVNNVDTPKEWNGLAATYSELTGLSGWTSAKDITVCSNRIVLFNVVQGAVRYPFRVIFLDFNARTFTATNVIDLTDVNDTIVAGRALTRTAFAVLGEQSQWVGTAQNGTFAFRVELQDTMPGPASPGSVIDRYGRLYYLGNDGSFYMFDGSRTYHIGEPIRKKVQASINYSSLGRVHGMWRLADRTFWWWYPTTASNPTVAVSFRPVPDARSLEGEWRYHEFAAGMELTASWPFKFISSLTWDTLPVAWTWDTINTDYSTWNSFPGTATAEELIGSTDQTYRFGDTGNDDGSVIAASWEMQAPWEPGTRERVDAYETFFKQTSSAVTATVSLGTTDTLATPPI